MLPIFETAAGGELVHVAKHAQLGCKEQHRLLTIEAVSQRPTMTHRMDFIHMKTVKDSTYRSDSLLAQQESSKCQH